MNIALLLSGGRGVRMGTDIPKQYMETAGRTVISFCIERLSLHEGIDALWIVADSFWHKKIAEELEKYDVRKKCRGFSVPGKNRQLSILQGLRDIRECGEIFEYVTIHDAVRPLVSEELISDCLNAVAGHEGVMPVLPMSDTVYVSEDGKKLSALLNRNQIFAGQAPEIFCLESYYKANVQLLPEKILTVNGSTEPAVMAGMDVIMIGGDEENFKITTKTDFEKFCKIIEEKGKCKRESTDESNGTT